MVESKIHFGQRKRSSPEVIQGINGRHHVAMNRKLGEFAGGVVITKRQAIHLALGVSY
ncbi:hypothetical protein D3C73_1399530 [compost metagenome]